MKVRLHWILFVILLISVVTCKQKFLYGNEIVHYLQNCIFYNIGKNQFKTPS